MSTEGLRLAVILVRTKPVRIFESDHAPLRLLAELERRSPPGVFHAALAEYLVWHRDEVAAVFADTQRAMPRAISTR